MIICNGDLQTCLVCLQMMMGTGRRKLFGGAKSDPSVRVAAPWIVNSAGFRHAAHLRWFDSQLVVQVQIHAFQVTELALIGRLHLIKY